MDVRTWKSHPAEYEQGKLYKNSISLTGKKKGDLKRVQVLISSLETMFCLEI